MYCIGAGLQLINGRSHSISVFAVADDGGLSSVQNVSDFPIGTTVLATK